MSAARALLFAALMATAACDDAGSFDKAVPFSRESLDGRSVALPRDGDGKLVVLHFWSGTSPGGDALLSALEDLRRENGGSNQLWLAVDVGENRAAAARRLAGRPIGYPVVPDPEASLARAYGVTDLPATVLIDRDGRVRKRIPATIPFGVVRSALNSLR